ncbi:MULTISPECIES: ATP-binding protein [unclassified Variovorax]|uniref:ATP-binding protein n=1 Tax=unclassified Variovorax TaxID=663243 RepID=UPI003F48F7EA
MSVMDQVLAQIGDGAQDASLLPETSVSDALLDQEWARQYRLHRIQIKDWGTYHGLLTMGVPHKGQLLVGHSGSGKSTIFDAHSVLLTPPTRLRLNQASRDSGKSADDRSVINYVRGVWGTAQGGDGRGVAKVLRPSTTWSAIAEVYRNGAGQVVTLAHLYWLRGASNDLHKRYLLAEGEFDLRELDFFPESDFDTTKLHRTLKAKGIEPFDAFSRYMAAFTKVLGIRDEMALRLLHKTQSTKSVDSITAFLREFMLDEPNTFEVAKNVVDQFQKLKEAHSDWHTATQQRDVLKPAREAHQRLQSLGLEENRLKEVASGITHFETPLGIEVHERAITRSDLRIRRMRALLDTRVGALQAAEARHTDAIRREALGGGDELRSLQKALEDTRQRGRDAKALRENLQAACKVLERAIPVDEDEFAQLYADASRAVDDGAVVDNAPFVKAVSTRTALEPPQKEAQAQLAALARAPRSNVPAEQQQIREALARALDVEIDSLPFAAELMTVKLAERRWQGAIERLVGGFAVTMLVPAHLFEDVRRFVDNNHLKGRLGYRPVRSVTEIFRVRSPGNVTDKIEIAPHEFSHWLTNEVNRQFDYACVESADDMGGHTQALSLNGQIKRARENYLKDDRRALDARDRWVLGTDTAARAEALHRQLSNINEQLEAAQKIVDAHEAQTKKIGQRLQACLVIAGMSWAALDEAGALAASNGIEKKIEQLKHGSPQLVELQAAVTLALAAKSEAQTQWADQHGMVKQFEVEVQTWQLRLDQLQDLPIVRLTPAQQQAVDDMRSRRTVESTPENYDRELTWMHSEANGAVQGNQRAQFDEKALIVKALTEFCAKTEWQAATKGHDPVLESFAFFDQHLTNLLLEGVSRTWERFLGELQEHNNHQLTLLSHSLSSERADMAKRLQAVNASLSKTAYNPGTHLLLHRVDCEPDESKVFRRELAVAMSEVINTDGAEAADSRYERLRKIAERLGSDRSEDIRWRSRVLDVRQHVQFDAHEIVNATNQVEQVYSGSDGKSGGQKQKLAATCMAAALRYQLAHPGGTVPQFAAVVVDEAFDRSDPDFTEAALNVFRELGFQIIVATPGKMVQTIEPYVGGAVWVYAKRGDRSNAVALKYDETSGRIDYSPMAEHPAKIESAFAK